MSVLEDENAIALRLRQIQEERATAYGINLPPTFGKLHVPKDGEAVGHQGSPLGTILFGFGQMYLYGEGGTAQVSKIASIMQFVARTGVERLILVGYAQEGEFGSDCIADGPGLAVKRAEYVHDCIRKGMLYSGIIVRSGADDGSILSTKTTNPMYCRRVDILSAS